MTPIEFVASLPHGEAKAAALTIYNLMTAWTEVANDTATLPPLGEAVIIRVANGLEGFGYLDEWTEAGTSTWHKILTPIWNRYAQSVDYKDSKICDVAVTHWRPI